jgi:uncharacterized protein (TIGR02996 family)
MHHIPFLLALPSDPLKDVNRLVYADWLEEQRHPLAELLRLQVAIRSLRGGDPEIDELADREEELLQTHAIAFASLQAELAVDTGQSGAAEAGAILEDRVLGLSQRHPTRFGCPVCHHGRAFKLDARNPVVLHWIVNPGLAFNELVLGQRVPATILVCRGCVAGSVRCLACRRLQPITVWNKPMGYWHGLHCPDCGSPVPLLRNLLAGAVVGLGKAARNLWAGLTK